MDTSYFHLAFEIEDTGPFQFNTLAGQVANNLSATPGSLEGMKLRFPKSLRPVRREHAVGCTRHWVFR
ncbi:MAG: hypothetical protein ABSB87_08270, partial [Terriglobales bacterium]